MFYSKIFSNLKILFSQYLTFRFNIIFLNDITTTNAVLNSFIYHINKKESF